MSNTQHPTTHPSARAGQKRKRTAQDSAAEEIAWTATRCNRLLRTLSSRVSALRKLVREGESLEDGEEEARKAPKRPGQNWSTSDPVWLPTGTRKPKKRTYTAKAKVSRRPRQQNVVSSGLMFPSPFVKRMTGDTAVQELKQAPLDRIRHRKSRGLPVKAATATKEVLDGLAPALSNFLAVTKEPEPPKRTGARSLLSTCLAKVPEYIETENEVDDESDDATTEILSYLESFGAREGAGWTGLRDVVRALGTRLICQAFSDGILPSYAVPSLVRACGGQDAAREGQEIVLSWLMAVDFISTNELRKLDDTCHILDSDGFRFRSLQILAKQDPTVLTRSTDMPRFCNTLLSSIPGPCGYEALSYLSSWANGLTKLARAGCLQEESREVFEETIYKLTAMAAAGLLVENENCSTRVLDQAVHTVVGSIPLQKLSGPGSCLALSSLFLCSLGRKSSPRPELLSALSQLVLDDTSPILQRRRSITQDSQERFVVHTAAALAALEKHLDADLPRRCVDRIVESLSDAPYEIDGLRKRIGLEIITVVRQSGNGGDDAAFSRYVQKLSSSTSSSMTPRTPCVRKAFRWEDGIGEWIKATPFATMSSAAASTHHKKSVSVAECSPDTLALSPARKRVKLDTRAQCEAIIQQSKGIVVIDVREKKRQTRWRKCDEASGDELAI